MPGVLSKIRDSVYDREWSWPYNCYEIGHPWTPNCSGAAWDIGSAGFLNSLPLYTSLYLFTQIGLQRKLDPAAFVETIKSILTSASFLGFNMFSGAGTSCLLRQSTDRYYYRLQCLVPGFVGSYLAMFIERPSRRPALAFYLANMSSELIYKRAASRGYIKPLPKGETLLFALGMSCWLRFVRIYGFGHDPVSTALKYLIGPHEAKSRAKRKLLPSKEETAESRELELEQDQEALAKQEQQLQLTQDTMTRGSEADRRKSAFAKIVEAYSNLLSRFFGSHRLCPHQNISCVEYTLTPAISRFLIGYTARSFMNLPANLHLLKKQPHQALLNSFKSQNSLYLGLFLATFVSSTRGVHCIFRRACNSQEPWHSAVAGGCAGMSMLFAPKATLSTYIVWKCLEQYFFLGVEKGYIKHPNQIIVLLYAISVNVLLQTFALEPRFIRPSYMKFIDKMSNHYLHQVNRLLLDVFGTGASQGYEDFFPDLDPKHMSRQFQELVFSWLIQPYE